MGVKVGVLVGRANVAAGIVVGGIFAVGVTPEVGIGGGAVGAGSVPEEHANVPTDRTATKKKMM